jgi:hypothetical protein
MKKKLIITESQYRRLINEQDDYTEQLLLLINSNDKTNLEMVKEIAPGQGIDLTKFLSDNIEQIEKPYFYKFDLLDLSEEEQLEILKYLFGDGISIDRSGYMYMYGKSNFIYDTKENIIYWEGYNDGLWNKTEYDLNGNKIYFENSDGYWSKEEYDSNGNEIYYENSGGYWKKKEFDSNGEMVYFVDSNGKIIGNNDNR